jgi:hypothetical protein
MSDYAPSEEGEEDGHNQEWSSGDEKSSGSDEGGTRPQTSMLDVDPALPYEGYRACFWDDDESYEGQWKDDMMHGQGTLKIKAGIFQGMFVKHQMHGPGRFDAADGTTYIGDFADNHFEGPGVIAYSERCIYSGEFHAGKRHGKGTMVFENDDKYEGEWANGVREGKGVYTAHMMKEIYFGGFRNNRRHGDGMLFFAERATTRNETGYKKLNATYEDGELVKKRQRPPQAPPMAKVDPRAAMLDARAKHARSMGHSAAFEPAGGTITKRELKEETDSEDDDFLAATTGGASAVWGADDGMKGGDEDDDEENVDVLENVGDGMDAAIDRLQKQRENVNVWDETAADDTTLLDRLIGCIPNPFRRKKEAEVVESKGALGKVDCILWVHVTASRHLPAMVNDESSNCFAEVVSRGQKFTTKVKENTLNPHWDESFDLTHSTTDEVQELTIKLYHKGRKPQYMGQLVRNLTSLEVGESVPADGKPEVWYDLVNEKGEKVQGQSEDGKKHQSKIKIRYGIKYKPDALVTVRLMYARKLVPPHFKSVGNPFVICRYAGKEIKSVVGEGPPPPPRTKWTRRVPLPVLIGPFVICRYAGKELKSVGGRDRENPSWERPPFRSPFPVHGAVCRGECV